MDKSERCADRPVDWLTTAQAAAYLGLKPKSLENMRHAGRGPAYMKLGRVFYLQDDLDDYIARRRVDPAERAEGETVQ